MLEPGNAKMIGPAPGGTLTPEVRATRGSISGGMVFLLENLLTQSEAACPPIPPAVTAVPCPPSSAPIRAGGSELKHVSGNEERSGCCHAWRSSQNEAFALREALLGAGDCLGVDLFASTECGASSLGCRWNLSHLPPFHVKAAGRHNCNDYAGVVIDPRMSHRPRKDCDPWKASLARMFGGFFFLGRAGHVYKVD